MKLITRQAAAEMLHATVRTVINLEMRGELPPSRHIGRRVYWSEDVFVNWLRERLEGDAPRKRTGRPRMNTNTDMSV